MATFRVIILDEFRWPSDKERVAGLYDLPPQALEQTHDIIFERDIDDLDWFRAAAVEFASGRKALLWWYERAPWPHGLELRIDAEDDPAEARAEAADALAIGAKRLIWAPDHGPWSLSALRGDSRTFEGTVYVVYRAERERHTPTPFVVVEVVWEEEQARKAVSRLNDAEQAYRYEYQRSNLIRHHTISDPRASP